MNSRIEKIGIFDKPSESLSELIAKADMPYIPPQFDHRKVLQQPYPDKVELSLLDLGYPIGNDSVIPTLQRFGYSAGLFDQLLLVGINNPDLQHEYKITAPGSVWAYRCSVGDCQSRYHCDHHSSSLKSHKPTELTTAYLGYGSIGDGMKRYLNFACPSQDFVWNEKTRFLIWKDVS